MRRGRALLAGLAGLFGGAALGMLLALAFVYLWFTVLKLPAFNDDPKPGITMLGGIVPIATGIGALAGVTGMVRRVRAGRSSRGWLIVFAAALLVVLIGLGLIVTQP